MSTLIDLTGKKFGRWTVLERSSNDIHNKPKWVCICECGTKKEVNGKNLRSGESSSCGYCLKNLIPTIHRTEGKKLYEVRLYGIWRAMRKRCYYEKGKDYENYGAKGIKVCDEWHDPKKFVDWAIKNGYQDDLELDRIDVNGNYEPANCRWVDEFTQANNKTNNHFVTINGITKTLMQWSRDTGIHHQTLRSRIVRGWKNEKLLLHPKRSDKNGR